MRFAKTGDPNGGNLPAWPRHDLATRPTMDFDTPIRVRDNPDLDVSNTWEGVWALPDEHRLLTGLGQDRLE